MPIEDILLWSPKYLAQEAQSKKSFVSWKGTSSFLKKIGKKRTLFFPKNIGKKKLTFIPYFKTEKKEKCSLNSLCAFSLFPPKALCRKKRKNVCFLSMVAATFQSWNSAQHWRIYVLTWLGFFMRVKFFSMQDEMEQMDYPRKFLSPSEARAWKRSEDNPFLPASEKILPKRSLAM